MGLVQNQEPRIKIETTAGLFFRKTFAVLYYSHLILISILIIFLTIRGNLSAARTHHFQPLQWYSPLFISIACAGIAAFSWQLLVRFSPSKAIKAAFWLSPILTCGVGVLHLLIGSVGGLLLGAISVLCAVIQSLYACWARPRFNYAVKVLSVSTAAPPAKTTILILLTILTTIVYSCFLVAGIGGASATSSELDTLFILVILLSMVWTMQVIKNTLLTIISRIKYAQFSSSVQIDTSVALCDTVKHLMGSIVIGSTIAPIIVIFRGVARSMRLLGGDTGEMGFSCIDCYSGVASTLIVYGNRWGFVHVGIYGKGFVQASSDTWEMFRRTELVQIIDSDLTGTFCFLCGMSGGGICTLVAGSWELAIQKSYATEVSICAFFIGYFICRIAMAWPQACVSAYYVAFAENPENLQFDSTIPVRLEQLQSRFGD